MTNLEPITREEHFMARAAGAGALELEPITREEHFLAAIASGGGSVTVDAALSASSENPVQNKTITSKINQMDRQLGELDTWIGDKLDAPIVITVTGTTPTIEPQANTIYNCGEVASLTISNPPATGKYTIIFYSGTTPTTTVGIENFAAEANKRYKITVEDNYATYDSWPYTPV